jgi:hypothetical protein
LDIDGVREKEATNFKNRLEVVQWLIIAVLQLSATVMQYLKVVYGDAE